MKHEKRMVMEKVKERTREALEIKKNSAKYIQNLKEGGE